jgi:hypothetical protein
MGSFIAHIKAQSLEIAIQAYKLLTLKLNSCRDALRDGLVFVKGRLTTAGLRLRETALSSLSAAKAAALEGYGRILAGARQLPVPVAFKNALFRVQTSIGSAILCVRHGFVCIQGKVRGAVVQVRVRVTEGYANARRAAIESYRRVATGAAMCVTKAGDTISSIRGNIGNALVRAWTAVSKRMASLRTQAAEMYKRILSAIRRLPGVAWVEKQVGVVKAMATDVYVYIRNGCIHAVTAVGDKLFYVRAKAIEGLGAAKFRILETYGGAKARVLMLLDRSVARLLATYDHAKKWAVKTMEPVVGRILVDMEPVIAKAADVINRSKAAAAARPVAVSAGSGGIAGLTLGGLTGAACGLPFAFLTLGLSIPIGATIGGAAGATTGAVGGGAVGYGYEHRSQIKAGVNDAFTTAANVKKSAVDSASSLVSRVRVGGA